MNFFRHRPWVASHTAKLLGIIALCGACASPPGTIGAALGQQPDRRLFVRSLPIGQGAERAGLHLDDEIVGLDGKDVATMTPDDVRLAVRGDVGSVIVVTIRRDAERVDVNVIRTPLLPPKP